MKAVEHKVIHQNQATNTSCSPTALAILLSYYGIQMAPKEIENIVPQVQDEEGNDRGTIDIQIATWCIFQGFDVTLYTFDCQIIDQSWSNLPNEKVKERLQASMNGIEVPTLGSLWSNAYRQAYIDFIDAKGKLIVQPYVTSSLLYELLEQGPVLASVSYSTLYGEGKERHMNDTETVLDDVNGRAVNHTIVIYGNNEEGDFLIADPWRTKGLETTNPEQLIAAISTAQMECDNQIFQLTK